MKDSDFDVIPVPPSYFQYMKNNELLEAQFTRFAAFANNLNTEKPVFAKRTALTEGLGWSMEKVNQNKKWLKDEEIEDAGGEGVEDEPPQEGGLAGPPATEEPQIPEQPEAEAGGEEEIKI
jgi:hypothetical protein